VVTNTDKEFPYIAERRTEIRRFVQQYLDHRNPNLLIGHFLDTIGCADSQLGLGGTCFALSLRKREQYDAPVLRKAHATLSTGLAKPRSDRDATERYLLKDVYRIPTKAVLLTLCECDEAILGHVLDNIFGNAAPDGLIRPVTDNPAIGGDYFVSCYVLQILHLSKSRISENYQLPISRLLPALRARLGRGDLDLFRKLLISTTLCLYDYHANIAYHEDLLRQLLSGEQDWRRSLATNSPFVDFWYGDTIEGGSITRYLRLPAGYIVLASFFVAMGSENIFFANDVVRQMLSELRLPFDRFVEGDRNRSAAYYLFFTNVCLHPSLYFDVPARQFSTMNTSAGQTATQSADLVVLVHGINTYAHWISTIKPALEDADFRVSATSYGRFGILRFLLPLNSLHRGAIQRVVTDIQTAIRIHNPRRMSVICHSFGTYVIARVLAEHPEFRWNRIIFCGSVLRDDFPLHQYLDRFNQPLINEVGTRDFLPALAQSVTWGYGSVGSNGYNAPPVETRWHRRLFHSDFLTPEFCTRFWIPFLRDGTIVRADAPSTLPLPIRLITKLPLRWLVSVSLLGGIAAVGLLLAHAAR